MTAATMGYSLSGTALGETAVSQLPKLAWDSTKNMFCKIFRGCFTEGTQIVVGAEYDDDGVFVQYVTVNIEDIQVGDLVYSYNTLTGEVSQKEVTATFVRTSDHINYLTIVDENGNEQTIETTDGHPFWVVTDKPDLSRAARDYSDGMYHGNLEITEHGFWVETKDLRVGDVFLGANGELSTLTNIVRVEQSGGIAVFNFEVEGNRNYFILAKDYEYGQSCVLVHNADGTLYRRGLRRQKVDEIADQCRAAEINPKSNFTHGISVSETVPTKPARVAERSDVEKFFTVHDTPLDWDPLHKTVEFQKPVTPEAVDVFYSLFRPGN